tara:strand:- start:1431 stop:2366 length:936 start_codon:yes stop_codon:yes gene_type:complete
MNCDKPVDIKDMGQTCKGFCSYKYDYNPYSSVKVKSMKDHLVIKVDGDNKITFNKYSLGLDQTGGDDTDKWDEWGAVKIFQPSIHLFNGKQTAGEIIISHSGSNHRVLVCVPIIVKDGGGVSNNFFSQTIPHILSVGTDPGVKNINVSKWSLNDIVPVGDFYFYNGALPYFPCTKNVETRINVIAFGIKSAATINAEDFTKLQSLITPITYSPLEILNAVANKEPLILMNKDDSQGGGAMGPSTQGSEYVVMEDCEYIDGMDKPKDAKPPSDISGWIIALIIIMGLIILFALSYVSMNATTPLTLNDGKSQ